MLVLTRKIISGPSQDSLIDSLKDRSKAVRFVTSLGFIYQVKINQIGEFDKKDPESWLFSGRTKPLDEYVEGFYNSNTGEGQLDIKG